jgi:hypothetical protein
VALSATNSSSLAKRERVSFQEGAGKGHARKRIGILCAFLGVMLALYIVMMAVAPQLDGNIWPFMFVWGGCFLLYFAVCIWILKTEPLVGQGYRVEIGLIFAGALVFRAMLLPLPLGLSRDAWRYLWDARMIMHGVNPYLYAPLDKALIPLRDYVFTQTPYREIPSEYPPGGQIFFLLGYLMMPTNLLATKAVFVLCDLVTSVAVALLLLGRKMDPRRFIIYAWCPLPIVEFAVQGHVDAVAIMFTALAVLCALSTWRGARVWAGVFLGMATLAKIYPIILLLAIVRRRDWPLLLACALTIALGYLPFILFSNGHWLAAPLSFVGQANLHPGVLPTLFSMLERHFHAAWVDGRLVTPAAAAMILLPVLVIVTVQRVRGRLSVEMAVLILVGSFMAASAHIFPWYATAFLPWLAVLIGPLWNKQRFYAKNLALVMVWYFTCTVTLNYFPGLKQYFTDTNWVLYFATSFGVVLLGWAVAAILGRVLASN